MKAAIIIDLKVANATDLCAHMEAQGSWRVRGASTPCLLFGEQGEQKFPL